MATGLMTVGKDPFGGWQYLYRLEVVIELATVRVAEYLWELILAGSNLFVLAFKCKKKNVKLYLTNISHYTLGTAFDIIQKWIVQITNILEHALTCLCMTHAERTAVLQRKNAGILYVSNMSSVSFSLFCFVFHCAG